MRLRLLFSTLSLGLAALLLAGAANALSIAYFLDQTNTQTTDQSATAYDPDNALPDGTNYLQVTFADSTTVAGDIDVTVAPLFPLTSIADTNFGVQSFFFNSTSTLNEADIIGLPVGWSANTPPPPNNGDGFGSFDVRVRNTGSSRQDPLSFSIRIDGDSINDYAVLSTGSTQGDTYFAAHVAGFLDQNSLDPLDDIDVPPLPPDPGLCYDPTGQGDFTPECNFLTSAWFGGTTIVPEPSTALLLLGGLSGLAVAGRRRLH